MERQQVMHEILKQVPFVKPEKLIGLLCGSCTHFPLAGKNQSFFCQEDMRRVNTDSTCCIHHKDRKKPRTSKLSTQSKSEKLPPDQWVQCSAGCGRWLKTQQSIAAGIGHGCKRKQEKEEKK